ncbi:hypothetical protein BUALT_Bualt05G0031800 [Buddleja alternifolia]|uniref:F-box/kelch-repeat protein SKIP25 n=1 Tax=Buddleja alternifolia TaxID=168488 RepID=A0AAV6XHS7_9LAMI|nr:hypothetical protein BUALT_Bualt05G0031800 [Buddleja alternifolia]
MTNPISTTTLEHPTPTTPPKRQKHRHHITEEHHHSLLPGLPDDIAHLCLSRVPPSTLYSVCHSWRRLIYSPSFPPFLSLYALCLPTKPQTHLSNPINFFSFDPISCNWQSLPPPPPLRFLFRHPSFISRKLPIQTAAVSENLVLLAATDDSFLPALSQPLVFNPTSKKWSHAPPLASARRWCAAGAVEGAVYVASGIGSHYHTDVARSVEKWDLTNTATYRWERMGMLKDGRFSRDAIEAVGWRGKLCMVNVKGVAAKEGVIYDVVTDTWTEMPEGMVAGWRGPAAAMAEESLYVVDECKGLLKMYDHVRDTWVGVAEDERLKGAQQVAAAGGRVCVLKGDGGGVTVVDVVAPPLGRVWEVEAPAGFQAVGIHILPRLSNSDF